ncbi:hypothetical protein KIPB_000059 [Kipferlia bialata]|uniref:Uncharacterized protein n=1 Tax=Kipferlia bialata TaxID=797122 RepID=A0A9K3CPU8_9EUKA|nr:hypothetical protein KIPB_000059 [Kipferlia bialata]|eukprot:g59.t1
MAPKSSQRGKHRKSGASHGSKAARDVAPPTGLYTMSHAIASLTSNGHCEARAPPPCLDTVPPPPVLSMFPDVPPHIPPAPEQVPSEGAEGAEGEGKEEEAPLRPSQTVSLHVRESLDATVSDASLSGPSCDNAMHLTALYLCAPAYEDCPPCSSGSYPRGSAGPAPLSRLHYAASFRLAAWLMGAGAKGISKAGLEAHTQVSLYRNKGKKGLTQRQAEGCSAAQGTISIAPSHLIPLPVHLRPAAYLLCLSILSGGVGGARTHTHSTVVFEQLVAHITQDRTGAEGEGDGYMDATSPLRSVSDDVAPVLPLVRPGTPLQTIVPSIAMHPGLLGIANSVEVAFINSVLFPHDRDCIAPYPYQAPPSSILLTPTALALSGQAFAAAHAAPSPVSDRPLPLGLDTGTDCSLYSSLVHVPVNMGVRGHSVLRAVGDRYFQSRHGGVERQRERQGLGSSTDPSYGLYQEVERLGNDVRDRERRLLTQPPVTTSSASASIQNGHLTLPAYLTSLSHARLALSRCVTAAEALVCLSEYGTPIRQSLGPGVIAAVTTADILRHAHLIRCEYVASLLRVGSEGNPAEDAAMATDLYRGAPLPPSLPLSVVHRWDTVMDVVRVGYSDLSTRGMPLKRWERRLITYCRHVRVEVFSPSSLGLFRCVYLIGAWLETDSLSLATEHSLPHWYCHTQRQAEGDGEAGAKAQGTEATEATEDTSAADPRPSVNWTVGREAWEHVGRSRFQERNKERLKRMTSYTAKHSASLPANRGPFFDGVHVTPTPHTGSQDASGGDGHTPSVQGLHHMGCLDPHSLIPRGGDGEGEREKRGREAERHRVLLGMEAECRTSPLSVPAPAGTWHHLTQSLSACMADTPHPTHTPRRGLRGKGASQGRDRMRERQRERHLSSAFVANKVLFGAVRSALSDTGLPTLGEVFCTHRPLSLVTRIPGVPGVTNPSTHTLLIRRFPYHRVERPDTPEPVLCRMHVKDSVIQYRHMYRHLYKDRDAKECTPSETCAAKGSDLGSEGVSKPVPSPHSLVPFSLEETLTGSDLALRVTQIAHGGMRGRETEGENRGHFAQGTEVPSTTKGVSVSEGAGAEHGEGAPSTHGHRQGEREKKGGAVPFPLRVAVPLSVPSDPTPAASGGYPHTVPQSLTPADESYTAYLDRAQCLSAPLAMGACGWGESEEEEEEGEAEREREAGEKRPLARRSDTIGLPVLRISVPPSGVSTSIRHVLRPQSAIEWEGREKEVLLREGDSSTLSHLRVRVGVDGIPNPTSLSIREAIRGLEAPEEESHAAPSPVGTRVGMAVAEVDSTQPLRMGLVRDIECVDMGLCDTPSDTAVHQEAMTKRHVRESTCLPVLETSPFCGSMHGLASVCTDGALNSVVGLGSSAGMPEKEPRTQVPLHHFHLAAGWVLGSEALPSVLCPDGIEITTREAMDRQIHGAGGDTEVPKAESVRTVGEGEKPQEGTEATIVSVSDAGDGGASKTQGKKTKTKGKKAKKATPHLDAIMRMDLPTLDKSLIEMLAQSDEADILEESIAQIKAHKFSMADYKANVLDKIAEACLAAESESEADEVGGDAVTAKAAPVSERERERETEVEDVDAVSTLVSDTAATLSDTFRGRDISSGTPIPDMAQLEREFLDLLTDESGTISPSLFQKGLFGLRESLLKGGAEDPSCPITSGLIRAASLCSGGVDAIGALSSLVPMLFGDEGEGEGEDSASGPKEGEREGKEGEDKGAVPAVSEATGDETPTPELAKGEETATEAPSVKPTPTETGTEGEGEGESVPVVPMAPTDAAPSSTPTPTPAKAKAKTQGRQRPEVRSRTTKGKTRAKASKKGKKTKTVKGKGKAVKPRPKPEEAVPPPPTEAEVVPVADTTTTTDTPESGAQTQAQTEVHVETEASTDVSDVSAPESRVQSETPSGATTPPSSSEGEGESAEGEDVADDAASPASAPVPDPVSQAALHLGLMHEYTEQHQPRLALAVSSALSSLAQAAPELAQCTPLREVFEGANPGTLIGHITHAACAHGYCATTVYPLTKEGREPISTMVAQLLWANASQTFGDTDHPVYPHLAALLGGCLRIEDTALFARNVLAVLTQAVSAYIHTHLVHTPQSSTLLMQCSLANRVVVQGGVPITRQSIERAGLLRQGIRHQVLSVLSKEAGQECLAATSSVFCLPYVEFRVRSTYMQALGMRDALRHRSANDQAFVLSVCAADIDPCYLRMYVQNMPKGRLKKLFKTTTQQVQQHLAWSAGQMRSILHEAGPSSGQGGLGAGPRVFSTPPCGKEVLPILAAIETDTEGTGRLSVPDLGEWVGGSDPAGEEGAETPPTDGEAEADEEEDMEREMERETRRQMAEEDRVVGIIASLSAKLHQTVLDTRGEGASKADHGLGPICHSVLASFLLEDVPNVKERVSQLVSELDGTPEALEFLLLLDRLSSTHRHARRLADRHLYDRLTVPVDMGGQTETETEGETEGEGDTDGEGAQADETAVHNHPLYGDVRYLALIDMLYGDTYEPGCHLLANVDQERQRLQDKETAAGTLPGLSNALSTDMACNQYVAGELQRCATNRVALSSVTKATLGCHPLSHELLLSYLGVAPGVLGETGQGAGGAEGEDTGELTVREALQMSGSSKPFPDKPVTQRVLYAYISSLLAVEVSPTTTPHSPVAQSRLAVQLCDRLVVREAPEAKAGPANNQKDMADQVEVVYQSQSHGDITTCPSEGVALSLSLKAVVGAFVRDTGIHAAYLDWVAGAEAEGDAGDKEGPETDTPGDRERAAIHSSKLYSGVLSLLPLFPSLVAELRQRVLATMLGHYLYLAVGQSQPLLSEEEEAQTKAAAEAAAEGDADAGSAVQDAQRDKVQARAAQRLRCVDICVRCWRVLMPEGPVTTSAAGVPTDTTDSEPSAAESLSVSLSSTVERQSRALSTALTTMPSEAGPSDIMQCLFRITSGQGVEEGKDIWGRDAKGETKSTPDSSSAHAPSLSASVLTALTSGWLCAHSVSCSSVIGGMGKGKGKAEASPADLTAKLVAGAMYIKDIAAHPVTAEREKLNQIVRTNIATVVGIEHARSDFVGSGPLSDLHLLGLYHRLGVVEADECGVEGEGVSSDSPTPQGIAVSAPAAQVLSSSLSDTESTAMTLEQRHMVAAWQGDCVGIPYALRQRVLHATKARQGMGGLSKAALKKAVKRAHTQSGPNYTEHLDVLHGFVLSLFAYSIVNQFSIDIGAAYLLRTKSKAKPRRVEAPKAPTLPAAPAEAEGEGEGEGEGETKADTPPLVETTPPVPTVPKVRSPTESVHSLVLAKGSKGGVSMCEPTMPVVGRMALLHPSPTPLLLSVWMGRLRHALLHVHQLSLSPTSPIPYPLTWSVLLECVAHLDPTLTALPTDWRIGDTGSALPPIKGTTDTPTPSTSGVTTLATGSSPRPYTGTCFDIALLRWYMCAQVAESALFCTMYMPVAAAPVSYAAQLACLEYLTMVLSIEGEKVADGEAEAAEKTGDAEAESETGGDKSEVPSLVGQRDRLIDMMVGVMGINPCTPEETGPGSVPLDPMYVTPLYALFPSLQSVQTSMQRVPTMPTHPVQPGTDSAPAEGVAPAVPTSSSATPHRLSLSEGVTEADEVVPRPQRDRERERQTCLALVRGAYTRMCDQAACVVEPVLAAPSMPTMPSDPASPPSAYTCTRCRARPAEVAVVPCGHLLCSACTGSVVNVTVEAGAGGVTDTDTPANKPAPKAKGKGKGKGKKGKGKGKGGSAPAVDPAPPKPAPSPLGPPCTCGVCRASGHATPLPTHLVTLSTSYAAGVESLTKSWVGVQSKLAVILQNISGPAHMSPQEMDNTPTGHTLQY